MFDESAEDAFRRLRLGRLRLPFPFLEAAFPRGLGAGDCVELCGDSGTGKTQLLLSLVASVVLPPSSTDNVALGGAGGGVLFVDMASQFDVFRLVAVLESKLERCAEAASAESLGRAARFAPRKRSGQQQPQQPQPQPPPPQQARVRLPDHDAIIKQCLARVHVFRPRSTLELLCTLRSLPSIAHNLPQATAPPQHLAASNGHREDVRAVVIDGAASFVWQDRLAPSGLGNAVASAIHDLQHKLRVAVVFTAQSMRAQFADGNQDAAEAKPLKVWPSVRRARFLLWQDPPFGPDRVGALAEQLVARHADGQGGLDERFNICDERSGTSFRFQVAHEGATGWGRL